MHWNILNRFIYVVGFTRFQRRFKLRMTSFLHESQFQCSLRLTCQMLWSSAERLEGFLWFLPVTQHQELIVAEDTLMLTTSTCAHKTLQLLLRKEVILHPLSNKC